MNIQGIGQVPGGLNCQLTFALGAALTLSIIEPAGQKNIGWHGGFLNQISPLDFDCGVIMDLGITQIPM